MVLVSVIVPIHRIQKLDRCVNSILEQSLKDIEIICISNKLNKTSSNIINELTSKDSRIKVYSFEKNKGMGKNKNLGIEKASGKYICFLNSSDLFYDNKSLEILYNEAEKNNTNLVSGQVLNDINNNEIIFQSGYKSKVVNSEKYDVLLCNGRNLFKKSFLEENNIQFKNLLDADDLIFLTDVLSKIDTYVEVSILFYVFNSRQELFNLDTSRKFIYYYKSFNQILENLNVSERFNNMIYNLSQLTISIKDKNIPEFTHDEFSLLNEEFDKMLSFYTNYGDNNLLHYMKNSLRSIYDRIYNRLTDFDVMVSVIIPTYNVEDYIDDCLNSIINQTYKNIEIICVDDCSSDSTVDIIRYYQKIDDRIQLILPKVKGGSGGCRNIGMKYAKGKYIQFLDSDDWIDFNTIEKTLKYAEENETQITMFKAINYGQDSGEFYKSTYYSIPVLDDYQYKVFNRESLSGEEFFQVMVSPINKLYLKSFLLAINPHFAENVVHTDTPFFHHIFCESDRSYLIDEYFYDRRRRDGSITTLTDETVIGSVDITEIILNVFLDNALYSEYKEGLLNYIFRTLISKYNKIDDSLKAKYCVKVEEFIFKLTNEYMLLDDLNEFLNERNADFFNYILNVSDYEKNKF